MKDLKYTVLLDFYNEFLTERQRRVMELYYDEDLSLREIAELVGGSRQAVRDGIKRGEQTLLQMEEKLHFASRFTALKDNYTAIAEKIQEIEQQQEDSNTAILCQEVKNLVQSGLKLL